MSSDKDSYMWDDNDMLWKLDSKENFLNFNHGVLWEVLGGLLQFMVFLRSTVIDLSSTNLTLARGDTWKL